MTMMIMLRACLENYDILVFFHWILCEILVFAMIFLFALLALILTPTPARWGGRRRGSRLAASTTGAQWDANQGANYFNTVEGGVTVQYWYDDAESLRPKYAHAASLGLRGVGPFTFVDAKGVDAMWRALDAFLKPGAAVGCSGLLWVVLGCSGLFWAALNCSGLFLGCCWGGSRLVYSWLWAGSGLCHSWVCAGAGVGRGSRTGGW